MMSATRHRPLSSTFALGIIPGLLLAFAWSVPGHAAEGRIPIYQPVELIATPDNPISGKYILTNDIEGDDGKAVITVKGLGFEQVDIDMNGFTITAGITAHEAIEVDDLQSFVLRNGRLVSSAVEGPVVRVGQLAQAGIVPVRRLLIENVTAIGGPGVGMAIYGVENFTLLDNNILEPTYEGIQVRGNELQSNTQGRVERNLVRGSGRHGIEVVHNTSSVIIRDNQIEGAGINGIHAAPGSGVAVIVNNAVEKTGLRGIFVNRTSSCRVEGNVIRGAGRQGVGGGLDGYGIHLANETTGCLVLNNSTGDSALHGIHVQGQANHLDRNVMIGNSGFGLSFTAPASKNTFGRNTARNNGGSCAADRCPGLASPDFCDTSGGGNTSFGDNLAPGTGAGPC